MQWLRLVRNRLPRGSHRHHQRQGKAGAVKFWIKSTGQTICTQFSGHWIKIESLRIHHGCFSEFIAIQLFNATATTLNCISHGKADSARFPEPAFPRFSGSTPDEAYPFPRSAPPVCQAHDKKYILQKQKSQTTNFDLIVWGFCFCVALVPLFLLKMPVTVWHFHITNSHQGFLIITDSVY